MLKNLETNPQILLNKINYDFLKLEQKLLLSQQRKTTKKIVRVLKKSFRRRKIKKKEMMLTLEIEICQMQIEKEEKDI